MRSILCLLFLVMCSTSFAETNSYLFVWAGDDSKKGNDFLAVLDADPASPRYGQAVASVPVPGPTGTPHHTEFAMPESGFLLANTVDMSQNQMVAVSLSSMRADASHCFELR